jgi:hypothetical protein
VWLGSSGEGNRDVKALPIIAILGGVAALAYFLFSRNRAQDPLSFAMSSIRKKYAGTPAMAAAENIRRQLNDPSYPELMKPGLRAQLAHLVAS